ncbi:hypothetical protein DTJ06_07945 [Parasaccharibacter sp. TMW 2.1886]|nr:hypothetical protein [Parasaccharibacter sp. TMW 2.1886]
MPFLAPERTPDQEGSSPVGRQSPDIPYHETGFFMSETLVLPLTGLKCDGCVRSLTRALEASPAIETATVTLDPPQAHIIFTGPALSREDCALLIQKAGFGTV